MGLDGALLCNSSYQPPLVKLLTKPQASSLLAFGLINIFNFPPNMPKTIAVLGVTGTQVHTPLFVPQCTPHHVTTPHPRLPRRPSDFRRHRFLGTLLLNLRREIQDFRSCNRRIRLCHRSAKRKEYRRRCLSGF